MQWDEQIVSLLDAGGLSGPLRHRTEMVWPKSRFMWQWGWWCLCGPVMWDEAFMPSAGTVSSSDHKAVI